MIVRKMQPRDVKTVYDMGMKVKEFGRAKDSRFWTKEQLRRWVASRNDVLLVAEENRKIMGFITSHFHKPTGKATLENAFVLREFRRRGIGTALLKECLKQLKQKGATYVCEFMSLKNTSAIKLSKSIGFKKWDNFVWMEKYL